LGSFIDANRRVVGFVYFNTSPQTTGATGNYRIDGKSGYLGAFRHSLRDIGLL